MCWCKSALPRTNILISVSLQSYDLLSVMAWHGINGVQYEIQHSVARHHLWKYQVGFFIINHFNSMLEENFITTKIVRTYPWQSSMSWGTRSLSLRPTISVEVVLTACDVTMISECNRLIEAFVLSNLASSSPLYSWLCSVANFFSCSIFTPSLAYYRRKMNCEYANKHFLFR